MSRLGRSVIWTVLFGLPALANSPARGINNFYQVNQSLYRGAQPTEEGFRYLAKIGVKTVLNLREDDERSSGEKALVTKLGMRYVNVPMTGLTPPTDAQILQILGLFSDQAAGTIFVHCKRGADRTGAVVGAYRIDHDHWDNARALQEANDRGMGLFQSPRRKFILAFHPYTIEAKTAPSFKSPKAGAPAAGLAAAAAIAVGMGSPLPAPAAP